MKALEMLYRDKKWIEEECDISKIPIERVQTMIKDLVEINEAIAELEALQSRSCESCRYCSGESKQSFCVLRLMPAHMYEFEFCCNRYEAKDNQ